MQRRVFISHSNRDAAENLQKLFEQNQLKTWMDRNELVAGDDIGERIQAAISACDCCVFVLDRKSAESSWCLAEVSAFWGAGKQVIVYHLDSSVPVPGHLASRRSTSDPIEVATAAKSSPRTNYSGHPLQGLLLHGAVSAFRIPAQNPERDARYTELLKAEADLDLRLLAASGRSFLVASGAAWKAGIGRKVNSGDKFRVVLASPFGGFAKARALANRTQLDHWKHSVSLPRLLELVDTPTVAIKVTEHPINCSLFFIGNSVFFDPYIWARPTIDQPTENNLWVIEFAKQPIHDPGACFSLLENHFDFLWNESLPLVEFVKKHERT